MGVLAAADLTVLAIVELQTIEKKTEKTKRNCSALYRLSSLSLYSEFIDMIHTFLVMWQ